MIGQGNILPAIIFARISSREQEYGVSIEAQLASIYEYCKRKNLTVIKEYAITESSIKGDRKQFKQMLATIRSRKDKVAIVVNCTDRLQRSYKETPLLDSLRRQDKIEVHFIKENLILHKDSSGMDIMFWNMSVLMANSYVLQLADNVKRSMRYNLSQGKWQTLAPLGYSNKRDAEGKAYIETDETRAGIVKKLFEDFATGLFTVTQLAERANTHYGLRQRRGTPVLRSSIYKLLMNPFYYGYMSIDKGKQLLPHKYEKLISKQLFDKCQSILRSRGKKGFRKQKNTFTPKEFAFRGLLKCGTCGCTITCEHHKKKSGKEFIYLKCHHTCPKIPCNEPAVNEKVLFQQLDENIFQKITPDNVKIINERIGKIISMLDGDYKNILADFKEEQAKLELNKSKLLDLLLENTITKEDYEFKISKINMDLAIIKSKISEKPSNLIDKLKKLQVINKVLIHGYEILMGSNVLVKNAFLNILCYNQQLSNGKLLKKVAFPLNLLTEKPLNLNWLREMDLNHRPSGYEPDELPGCSIPR